MAFTSGKPSGARKQPYYVRATSGQPLAFAGLWETWTGPNGEEMETAAIVTTHANRALAGIHERMLVIIPPEAFNLWLDCTNVDAETAACLVMPASDKLLEAFEVSTAVNRTANDDPRLIEPVRRIESEHVLTASTLGQAAKRVKKDDGQGVLF
jgi:putative SOS response-associated peptidase YedK